MPSSPNQGDRKKLTWLCIGFVLYFCVMVYGFRYASTIPYQMLAVSAVLNMAIILFFVFGIKRVYRRMQTHGRAEVSDTIPQTKSGYRPDVDRQRVKGLWAGVVLYSFIFLNGIRLGFAYAGRLPLPLIALAELLNGAILITLIFTLRKVHKRIR